MRRHRESIEIQEPPIKELGKKRSCLKSTCTTGCGCIVIFIIASLLLVKFIAAPRAKELKQIPANFPTGIPIYDKDNIDKITYLSGAQKNRGLEIAGYLPKFVLSPIMLLVEKKTLEPSQNIQAEYDWKNINELIKKPIADHRSILQIEWSGLPAEPEFIKSFLIEELKKNYYYEITANSENIDQFIFNSPNKNIEGSVYIQKNDPSKKGTDYMSLIVNYPEE
ncbi:MAG: hypothetical protein US42_C0011G0056 [Candidatus Magasanikbacteria bacterium GW2011_GWC2_37_14]|uniref:Uncharacterized protein n=1 Tax=Candidatus Magasanikbacteria bacterium GW2011_GWC2_37_14 TaxID=1619046 RepID=A0A0G0G886_9BACT|nr:MAG: hypothetical protein US42_C0011G0056 [Candidatus Magasanikbacteria bacterium GW2011_GWC2_37_14]